MAGPKKLKVLFVCLGNICRSPLAEGVFRHQVEAAGLADRIETDSAGTSAYHIGDPPDARTARVARARGITLNSLARQVTHQDLRRFDYIVVMDRQNLANVQQLAADAPPMGEIVLLRDFDQAARADRDVPDPYYGGPRGFEDVHDIVERSCAQLLRHIREQQHW
jgi:protein-tyrosine phosphatase